MIRTITFNVPVGTGRKAKTIQAKGIAINLPVGEKKIRFVLQFGADGKPFALTHHASGAIIGRLNDEKIRAMVSRGHHCQLSDRSAGAALLARIIERHGVGTVQHKLLTATVVNPEA